VEVVVSYYQKLIELRLVMMNRSDVNPAHIEAWMRLEHGTLDALSARAFAREVAICVDLVDEAGLDRSDELAMSYGLLRRAS
jgi:hypothetical protein